MCLGVPGKIISITESKSSPSVRTGKVSFGGILRDVNLTFLPEAQENDYVIVHVGVAISKIDESEAERVFMYMKEAGIAEEVEFKEEGEIKGESFVITIDGPAASGKTTVSRELSKKLQWPWVSTGAFYRGLAYVSMQMGVSVEDEDAIEQCIPSPRWKVILEEVKTRVFFDGKDVTDDLASDQIGQVASRISQFPKIRAGLLEAQRACAYNRPGLIAEGRDCGSVVFPRAEIKVYLTADPVSRAQRRAKDLGTSKDSIQKSQQQRDKQDSERKTAPLKIADGALVIDTTDIPLEQVVGEIEKVYLDRAKKVQ